MLTRYILYIQFKAIPISHQSRIAEEMILSIVFCNRRLDGYPLARGSHSNQHWHKPFRTWGMSYEKSLAELGGA